MSAPQQRRQFVALDKRSTVVNYIDSTMTSITTSKLETVTKRNILTTTVVTTDYSPTVTSTSTSTLAADTSTTTISFAATATSTVPPATVVTVLNVSRALVHTTRLMQRPRTGHHCSWQQHYDHFDEARSADGMRHLG